MELKDLKLTDKRKLICEKLNLNDSDDILRYYPFRYEEHNIKHFKDFKEGEEAFFEAELISSPSTYRYQYKKSVTRFKVLYEDEEINVTIYNRPWAKSLAINSKLSIIGKYEGNNKVVASNYYQKEIKDIAGIMPIYSLKEGINQNEIRKLIEFVYLKSKNSLIDELPSIYRENHQLLDYKDAILNIHFPSNYEMLKKSLSRLKYEEFLRFYLALEYLKTSTSSENKKIKNFNDKDVENFINSFDFKLTGDQLKASKDIIKDLKSNKTMYRLLQGDVGSGKTAVAMIALFANYLSGYQGAIMAPTEILAKQHYDSFLKLFENTNVRIALLYSGLKEANEIKEDLKNGKIDIVIGTHALFQEDVEFNSLGLVIADEQHRFGVKQRRALKEKGKETDFLLMSATPIPRTLASSIYGDMDVSTIEALPKERKGCKTYLIKKNSIVDIIEELKNKLNEGRQVYIIAAAIEASDNFKAKDTERLHQSLTEGLSPFSVGLLHGRMSSDEKDLIMTKFNNNQIQVLVSTTVVEVGMNVKNATVMVIYDADRFGLSQLHQLRGRIQRGDKEGTCYLLTDNKEKEVLERLNVLCKTNDGFEISMQDLKLRGPGDILGTRQSGLPAFILGNLLEDDRFIKSAKLDAKEIYKNREDKENERFYKSVTLNASKNVID